MLAVLLLVPLVLGVIDGTGAPIPESEETIQPRAAPPQSPPSSAAGDEAFADLVVVFRPGDAGAATASPTWTLGPPDIGSTGLGRRGCLLLTFTDLVIVNDAAHSGADLRIYMRDGALRETARLGLSLDGVTFEDHGSIGGSTLDIDLSSRSDLPAVRYLRFRDTGANTYSYTSSQSGWDLDAVEALSYTAHPDPTLGLLRDTTLRESLC